MAPGKDPHINLLARTRETVRTEIFFLCFCTYPIW